MVTFFPNMKVKVSQSPDVSYPEVVENFDIKEQSR